jgi:hypothetical protein
MIRIQVMGAGGCLLDDTEKEERIEYRWVKVRS